MMLKANGIADCVAAILSIRVTVRLNATALAVCAAAWRGGGGGGGWRVPSRLVKAVCEGTRRLSSMIEHIQYFAGDALAII